jgi:hypothetical protein
MLVMYDMLRALGLLYALCFPFATLADQRCSAQILVDNEWYNVQNNTAAGALDITLSNAGSDNITVPYTVGVQSASYTAAPNVWNLRDVRVNNGNVTGSATEFWETIMSGSRNAVNLGMVVEFNKTSANSVLPTSVIVGGVSCDIVTRTSAGSSQPAVGSSPGVQGQSPTTVNNTSSTNAGSPSPGLPVSSQGPSPGALVSSPSQVLAGPAASPQPSLAPTTAPDPATTTTAVSPSSATPAFSGGVAFAPLSTTGAQPVGLAPQSAPTGAPAP